MNNAVRQEQSVQNQLRVVDFISECCNNKNTLKSLKTDVIKKQLPTFLK